MNPWEKLRSNEKMQTPDFKSTFENHFQKEVYDKLFDFFSSWNKKEQEQFLYICNTLLDNPDYPINSYIQQELFESSKQGFIQDFLWQPYILSILGERKDQNNDIEALDNEIDSREKEFFQLKEFLPKAFNKIFEKINIEEKKWLFYKNGVKIEVKDLYAEIIKDHYDILLDEAREHPYQFVLVYEYVRDSWEVDVEELEKDYGNIYELSKHTIDPTNKDGPARQRQVEIALWLDTKRSEKLSIDGDNFIIGDEQVIWTKKYIRDSVNGFKIESADIAHIKRDREYLEEKNTISKSINESSAELKILTSEIWKFRSLAYSMQKFDFATHSNGEPDEEGVEAQLVQLGTTYNSIVEEDPWMKKKVSKIKAWIKGLQEDEWNIWKQKKLQKTILDYLDHKIDDLESDRDDILKIKEEKEEELQDLERKEIRRVGNLREQLNTEDEKAREMMNALRLLWMHLLPQSVFDHIVRIINEEDALRGQIKLLNGQGLNGKINPGDLEFGQKSSETYKKVLVQLINKDLTWSPETPHSIEGFMNGNVFQMTEAEFRHKAENEWWIISDTWGVNVEKLRENLTKEVRQVIDDTREVVIQTLDAPNNKRWSRRQKRYS